LVTPHAPSYGVGWGRSSRNRRVAVMRGTPRAGKGTARTAEGVGMSATAVVLAVILVVLVVAVAWWRLWTKQRRERLREQFGGEYERAVADRGSEWDAEHELIERSRRHEQLHIRVLAPEQ